MTSESSGISLSRTGAPTAMPDGFDDVTLFAVTLDFVF